MLLRSFIIIIGLALAVPVSAQSRIALLIGNQDYGAGVGTLINPLNDTKLVANALRKVGFRVMPIVKNGTRADILDALDKYVSALRDAGPDAIGFIYYSGHGIAARGVNYIIPVDVARPSTRLLRAGGVKQSEVLDILQKEAPNAAHYFVIDACRNELRGSRGAKGFVPVNQQAGTLIAFATAPGQTASDVGNGGGPYAKALANELVKPNVPDLLMFHRVRVAVRKSTGGDQVPWTLDGIQRDQRPELGNAVRIGDKGKRQTTKPQTPKRPKPARKPKPKVQNGRVGSNGQGCLALPARMSSKIAVRPGLVLCNPQQQSSRIEITAVLSEVVRYKNGSFGITSCYSDDKECGVHWGGPSFRIEAGEKAGSAYFVPIR
ncbi:MAG: caspase family protein [Pseudomonadota bacterium]